MTDMMLRGLFLGMGIGAALIAWLFAVATHDYDASRACAEVAIAIGVLCLNRRATNGERESEP